MTGRNDGEPGGSGAAFKTLAAALGRDLSFFADRARRQIASDGRRMAEEGAVYREALRNADYASIRDRLSSIGRRKMPSSQAAKRPGAHGQASGSRSKLWRWLALSGACLSLIFVGVLIWALHDVPLGTIMEETSRPTILLEAADGQALVAQGPYQGAIASREDFPDHLVNAVIATEDRRFKRHIGIDLRGIVRASGRNFAAGEVVEGGSTITQQLLKILYLERDRKLKRKIQEAFLALWLETRMTKDEILTLYLNNIYLGAGATGVPAAALVYFGKTVDQLTLSESALLAGLIKAPSQLNPLENLEAAQERALVVLGAMRDAGYLDEAELADAQANSAELKPVSKQLSTGTWFADWVIDEAREIAGPFRGAITVKTSLVPALQEMAETAVREGLEAAISDQPDLQAALVAMRPDGAVVAMVGGRDYETSEFNRAVTAERQPGSTFKLFVFYAALQAGLGPRDMVRDGPVDIDGWTPENFNGRYAGRVSLAEAFARSLNAATVHLAVNVGIDKVAQAARDLGIDAPLQETPSLALGTSEVSLIDLTGAYASIRAGRAPIEPWGIQAFASEGQDRMFRIGPSKAADQDIAQMREPMIDMLRLVVEKGTGKAAALDGFAAGKTGTSQNFRDAWFIGFNEDWVTGVWVGNDDGEPMDGVTGGQLPAQIWQRFMSAASSMRAPAQDPAQQTSQAPEATDAEQPQAPETVSCNVRACQRAYRSFRSSDCTFQPYRGGRKLCTR